jgi:uncharacterized protein YigE (DUF2233 family)
MRSYLLLLLLLAACSQAKPALKPAESSCRREAFEGSRFTVCDNRGGDLVLVAASNSDPPLRSFGDFARRLKDPSVVAFGMNAGMFDEAGRPIGYSIADSAEVKPLNLRDGPGNFHLKPNGVFMVTCGGSHAIFPSDAMPSFRCAPRLATQSGPLLVINGKLHPKLQFDGKSRLIRNGVGTREGRAVFVISETPVSLGKFARFFRDELKARDALYFDGSVSSLWDPANGRMDSFTPLGPMIIAFKPVGASKPGREGHARP